MTSADPTAIFKDSWSLYDLITEYNYMSHQEIYAGVDQLLRSRNSLENACLLDLGCGNARYLAPCLKRSSPALYQGVDLSEDALVEARAYLTGLPGQVILTHANLLDAIESTDKVWDVIFTSFAIHHLTLDAKKRFFQAVGNCLSQDGWLILVDVVRDEGQSRKSYLDGYLNFMREGWTKVPHNQLEEACTHVHDWDYPEPLSSLQEMAISSGLKSCRLISRYAQHHTLLFSRSPAEGI